MDDIGRDAPPAHLPGDRLHLGLPLVGAAAQPQAEAPLRRQRRWPRERGIASQHLGRGGAVDDEQVQDRGVRHDHRDGRGVEVADVHHDPVRGVDEEAVPGRAHEERHGLVDAGRGVGEGLLGPQPPLAARLLEPIEALAEPVDALVRSELQGQEHRVRAAGPVAGAVTVRAAERVRVPVQVQPSLRRPVPEAGLALEQRQVRGARGDDRLPGRILDHQAKGVACQSSAKRGRRQDELRRSAR